jgi:hypothetical protein
MSKRRTTYGKMQRERDRKERAVRKAERKATRAEEESTEPAGLDKTDEQSLIEALEDLHAKFADGAIDLESFEARRDELIARLTIV